MVVYMWNQKYPQSEIERFIVQKEGKNHQYINANLVKEIGEKYPKISKAEFFRKYQSFRK
jgi:hypothetical protein